MPCRSLPLALAFALALAPCGCDGAGGEGGGASDAGRDTGQPSGSDAAGRDVSDTGVADGTSPADAGDADVGQEPVGCVCATGPCVRRELEEAACRPACGADRSCPVGDVCVTFPVGPRCEPAGERADGFFCNGPAECEGGLCVWGGGGAALCTRECTGPGDASCGEERACLPSVTPPGAWHCYFAGALETGVDCLNFERECAGGFCLGQGVASYCSEVCDPAASACPEDWECAPRGDGHVCCDPMRDRGSCRG